MLHVPSLQVPLCLQVLDLYAYISHWSVTRALKLNNLVSPLQFLQPEAVTLVHYHGCFGDLETGGPAVSIASSPAAWTEYHLHNVYGVSPCQCNPLPHIHPHMTTILTVPPIWAGRVSLLICCCISAPNRNFMCALDSADSSFSIIFQMADDGRTDKKSMIVQTKMILFPLMIKHTTCFQQPHQQFEDKHNHIVISHKGLFINNDISSIIGSCSDKNTTVCT